MSRLIETVAFRVPAGFNAAAEAAAKSSGVVVSEFMRKTLLERIEELEPTALPSRNRAS